MREDDPRFRGRGNQREIPDILPTAIRFVGLACGIVLLVVGATCMLRVFSGVYSAVTQPAELEPMVEQWNELIDGSEIVMKLDDQNFGIGKVISVILMGVGALIMAHISLTMFTSGTKMLIICLDDNSRMRLILKKLIRGEYSDSQNEPPDKTL